METLFFIFIGALTLLAIIIGRRMWMVTQREPVRPSIFDIHTIAYTGRSLFIWIPAIVRLAFVNSLTGIQFLLHSLVSKIDVIIHRHRHG